MLGVTYAEAEATEECVGTIVPGEDNSETIRTEGTIEEAKDVNAVESEGEETVLVLTWEGRETKGDKLGVDLGRAIVSRFSLEERQERSLSKEEILELREDKVAKEDLMQKGHTKG